MCLRQNLNTPMEYLSICICRCRHIDILLSCSQNEKELQIIKNACKICMETPLRQPNRKECLIGDNTQMRNNKKTSLKCINIKEVVINVHLYPFCAWNFCLLHFATEIFVLYSRQSVEVYLSLFHFLCVILI